MMLEACCTEMHIQEGLSPPSQILRLQVLFCSGRSTAAADLVTKYSEPVQIRHCCPSETPLATRSPSGTHCGAGFSKSPTQAFGSYNRSIHEVGNGPLLSVPVDIGRFVWIAELERPEQCFVTTYSRAVGSK